jgi:trans-aconitate methyltransferase
MEVSQARPGAHASDVKAMYEVFPYPSPTAGDSVIEDVASGIYSLYGSRALEGWRVLDAGCGTGHRLVGVARRYPRAQFVGLDMTAASLQVAEQLARKHGVRNVRFEQGDLLNLQLRGEFDLIISTGVIVCLEQPQQGLRNLASLLAPDGLLMVWLYHAIGEHQRMLERELLHVMWNAQSGFERGVQMMRDLGLTLEVEQYGKSAAQQLDEVSRLNIDVDAYMHPIVNVYRCEQAVEMFSGCGDLGWAAINSMNRLATSKLIDLAEAEHSQLRHFTQTVEQLFDKPALQQRFRALDKLQQLRVLELMLKPTGFTIIGGRGRSHGALGPRVTGNAMEFARN